MTMQDIDDQKTRETNQAIEWFIRRHIAGLLQEPQEPQDFQEPDFIVKMRLVQSIANRLQEIELPERFASLWQETCDALQCQAAGLIEAEEFLRAEYLRTVDAQGGVQ